MVTKKVKKIIRKKLYEYPIYERIINELELEKDTTEGGDINSSIRSKNKIKEYQEWKKLIDNILQELRKYDKTKLKVVEYKFFGNIPEDVIADELYVSKTTVRTYINDIYFEVGIQATFNNLITKSMFSS